MWRTNPSRACSGSAAACAGLFGHRCDQPVLQQCAGGGDADRHTELPQCGEHSRSSAGEIVGHQAHGDRVERGLPDSDAESRDEHAGQDRGPRPVRLGAPPHPGHADAAAQHAGNDQPSRTGPVGDLADRQGGSHRRDRLRERREAGGQWTQAHYLLQVKHGRQHQAGEGEHSGDQHSAHEAEVAVGEQRERNKRVPILPPGLLPHEGREQPNSGGEDERDVDRAGDVSPAVALAFDDPVADADQRRSGEHDAGQVEPEAPARAATGQGDRRQREDRQAERQVDQEDPPPAASAHHNATDQRAGNEPRRGYRAPHTECHSAAVGRKRLRQQRQPLRQQHRCGYSLRDARGDQHPRAARQAAHQ
ncbi:hypothetical protein WEH80_26685 [Actinomycetes bacterium KLBMP 9759]